MSIRQKALSVSQTAALCGVGRTTVGYWIRSRKLRASRVGRNYSIPVQDLLFFLKSNGHEVPLELQGDNLKGPIFRSFQHCWEYWHFANRGQTCEGCVAFKNQIEVCFNTRHSSAASCSKACDRCQYYLDIFLPRIHFVHQINMPAAVVNDLYFWCGNRKWEQLCGVQKKDLIGMGVEDVVHPDSLASVISGIKRKVLENPELSEKCHIYIKNSQFEKIKIKAAVFPLNEPESAFLVLAESTSMGIQP